jgi:CspA family cold shock protein
VQGVIKSYDPATRDGIVVRDTDLTEYDLAPTALDGSLFRMLRQGQRVCFELDASGRADHLSLGSEADMGTPAFLGARGPGPGGVASGPRRGGSPGRLVRVGQYSSRVVDGDRTGGTESRNQWQPPPPTSD